MLSMVLEEKQRTLQDHRRKPTPTLREKKSFAGGMTHQLTPIGLVSMPGKSRTAGRTKIKKKKKERKYYAETPKIL